MTLWKWDNWDGMWDVSEEPPMAPCVLPVRGPDGWLEALVSPEDRDYLSQWSWGWKRSRGGLIYARRNFRWAGGQSSIYMHYEVMARKGKHKPPTPRHTVDHMNRNTLDNTRPNLDWATPEEQEMNKCSR